MSGNHIDGQMNIDGKGTEVVQIHGTEQRLLSDMREVDEYPQNWILEAPAFVLYGKLQGLNCFNSYHKTI